MEPEPLKLPGLGLPIDHRPAVHFPEVMTWSADALTLREITMLRLMNSFTDKPDWHLKVFDEHLIQKWGQEAMDTEGMDVTDAMLDYCFAELQSKALSFKKTGSVLVFDGDVAIAKSDLIIDTELNKALRVACTPLEKILEKDWHPGSDEKVLDLVHPSLFPLVYGRSWALPAGKVGLEGCEDSIGKGQLVEKADFWSELTARAFGNAQRKFWSQVFQWLPCDVALCKDNGVEITSYINNLQPGQHAHLYSVIERIIAKSIPLWDEVLSWVDAPRTPRIVMSSTEYTWPNGRDVPEDYVVPEDKREEYGLEELDEYAKQSIWAKLSRVLVIPEPEDFSLKEVPDRRKVSLRTQFAETGLQIIVKLANIELSPEKPEYEGGSWHVEGQLNEHICASALYYYDSENITESFLEFRQGIDSYDIERQTYDQDDYEGVEQIYGIGQSGPTLQDLGRILTKEGRLIAFPNVLQHRVSSFRLADSSKSGHRKILALFLVDPNIRIISTANVPPQQKSWLSREVLEKSSSILESTLQLPNELVDKIVPNISCSTMTLEEAKEHRFKLMEERKTFVSDVDNEVQQFNFCEH